MRTFHVLQSENYALVRDVSYIYPTRFGLVRFDQSPDDSVKQLMVAFTRQYQAFPQPNQVVQVCVQSTHLVCVVYPPRTTVGP